MSNAPPLGPRKASGSNVWMFVAALCAIAILVCAGVLGAVYVRELQQQRDDALARAERMSFTKGTGGKMLPIVFKDSGARQTSNDFVWITNEGAILGTNSDLKQLTKRKTKAASAKAYQEAVDAFLRQGSRLVHRRCYMAESPNRFTAGKSWTAGYCADTLATPR